VPRNPPITSATFVSPTFEPLAVKPDQAAELLGNPIEEIEAAAHVTDTRTPG
jgi:hypothetical protein